MFTPFRNPHRRRLKINGKDDVGWHHPFLTRFSSLDKTTINFLLNITIRVHKMSVAIVLLVGLM